MIKNYSTNHCCGIAEWGFKEIDSTSDKWTMKVLVDELGGDMSWGRPEEHPIIMFSGASNQEARPLNPFSFAAWLERRGERVIKSLKVLHTRHGNRIQGFFWKPSRAFMAKYDKAVKEWENEGNEPSNW